mmetsp:Transcript_25951/g.68059  ORF Transcript_25951/g.68059 Transcript_25951/m.68059 type:complete len:264 (-) Transcript_25951:25-816(-)
MVLRVLQGHNCQTHVSHHGAHLGEDNTCVGAPVSASARLTFQLKGKSVGHRLLHGQDGPRSVGTPTYSPTILPLSPTVTAVRRGEDANSVLPACMPHAIVLGTIRILQLPSTCTFSASEWAFEHCPISPGVSPVSVHLPTFPLSLVPSTIRGNVSAFAMLATLHPHPIIHGTIVCLQLSMSVHHVLDPLTIVIHAIRPCLLTNAMCHGSLYHTHVHSSACSLDLVGAAEEIGRARVPHLALTGRTILVVLAVAGSWHLQTFGE